MISLEGTRDRCSTASSELDLRQLAIDPVTDWHGLLDGLPHGVFVVDSSGAVALMNHSFCQMAGQLDPFQQLDDALREAIAAANVDPDDLEPGGEEWAEVTAVLIIRNLAATNGQGELYMESRLGQHVAGLQLRVESRALNLGGAVHTVFSVYDVTHEQYRRTLESIFLHDIMNTAGVIRGLVILASTGDGGDIFNDPEFRDAMVRASETMVDEIQGHSQLLHAELGDIEVIPQTIDANAFVNDMRQSYSRHKCGIDRNIEVSAPPTGDPRLVSSTSLVGRVVGNMIKNALENTPEGGSIRTGWYQDSASLVFWVHNDEVIPEWAQRQIFQRSFSTKGPGRGQGTYSMRLLAEQFLYGTVWFQSMAGEGTTFYLRLPREWPGSTEYFDPN